MAKPMVIFAMVVNLRSSMKVDCFIVIREGNGLSTTTLFGSGAMVVRNWRPLKR